MKSGKLKMIAILLLCAVLLSGCDIRNYFYTEDGLKRVAEKSLKKKYGEDFVVYRAWDRSQELFFADCSPKDNPDVVFQADIYKNGSGIYADGYAQGVIAKEVNELLKDKVTDVYGKCYTRVHYPNYYNVPEFANAKNVTLEEYMSEINLDFIGYEVYIVDSEIQEETVKAEYQFWNEEIQEMIKNEKIPDLVVKMYFVDEEMLKKCEDYYATVADTKGDFSHERYKYDDFGFRYDGNIDMSYDEYEENRLKNNANEEWR